VARFGVCRIRWFGLIVLLRVDGTVIVRQEERDLGWAEVGWGFEDEPTPLPGRPAEQQVRQRVEYMFKTQEYKCRKHYGT